MFFIASFLSISLTLGTLVKAQVPANPYGCIAVGTIGSGLPIIGGPNVTDPIGMSAILCQRTVCPGFPFAGLFNGSTCFCGNSLASNGATGVPLPSTIASAKCNVPCVGAPTLNCGGSSAVAVFSTDPITTRNGWFNAGCYIDNVGNSAFGTPRLTDPNMSNELCQDTCDTAKLTLAATENTNCFCGNSLTSNDGNVGTHADLLDCNFGCPGSSSTRCGNSAGTRLTLSVKTT